MHRHEGVDEVKSNLMSLVSEKKDNRPIRVPGIAVLLPALLAIEFLGKVDNTKNETGMRSLWISMGCLLTLLTHSARL